MSDLIDLLLLLGLVVLVVLWLRLSVARERAIHLARQKCEQHGLQLLDETVGMRGLGLRRVNGLQRVERCYGFEVSTDGDDRQSGRLWMIDSSMTRISLPTVGPFADATPDLEPGPAASHGTVVDLDARRRAQRRLH